MISISNTNPDSLFIRTNSHSSKYAAIKSRCSSDTSEITSSCLVQSPATIPAAAAASTNASVKSATIAKSTYEAVANVELARASKSFGARPYEGAVEYKLSENLPQQLR